MICGDFNARIGNLSEYLDNKIEVLPQREVLDNKIKLLAGNAKCHNTK